jgi:glyoxylase-like metal-dependent hydrolase (beta-lactamase superfamily II)
LDHTSGDSNPCARDPHVHYDPIADARHLLGQADWAALQDDLKSPASPTSRALGLAWRHGMLDLVGEQRVLGDGLSLLPTPGETPGHLALRAESQGGDALLRRRSVSPPG